MADAQKPKAEPWYPFGSGPPVAKAAHDTHDAHGSHAPAPAAAQPDVAKPHQAASVHKPAAEPWYPFGSGPPVPKPAHDVHASTAASPPTATTGPAPGARATVDFKSGVSGPAAAMTRAGADSLPTFVRMEPDIASELLREKPAISIVKPVSIAASEAPKSGSSGSGSGAKPAIAAKMEQSHAPDKPAHVHVHPPVPPRSAFGDLLHAEAKEINRANGVVNSALSQGLAVDAIHAVVEARLQGHAKDIAVNLVAGATDAATLSARLTQSQKIAGAIQSAASKADGPEQAKVIVSTKLRGEDSVAAAGVISGVADLQHSKSGLVQTPAPYVPDVAAAKISGLVESAVQASMQPVIKLEIAPTPPLTAVSQPPHLAEVAKFEQAAAPVQALVPAVVGKEVETAQAAPAPATMMVAAEVAKLEQAAAVATKAVEAAAAAPSGVTVRAIEMPKIEIATKGAGPAFVFSVPAPESALSNLGGRPEKLSELKPEFAKLDSAQKAAEILAVPAVGLAGPEKVSELKPDLVNLDTGSRGAPVEERSTISSANARADVPVEDRSTPARDERKVLAPVEDRSVTAASSGPHADKPAPTPERYSDMGAKGLIAAAASAISSVPDKVSSMAHQGLEKAEAAAHKAVDSVSHAVQAATHTSAKVTLEEALTAHMRDKGFDDQSIAAAKPIAEAIRNEPTGAHLGEAVLVLHKEGVRGDPLATVVAAKDVHAIAKPGDSVLALDTLEKIASKGLDSAAIKEVRSAMPEAVKGQTDLEMSQSSGDTKSALKGLEQLQAPEQQSQKQEKVAAAEQSLDAAMSHG